MRILLVGYGKMGQLVGQLAPQFGAEVAGIVDPMSPAHVAGLDDPRWHEGIDVAIDFTSPASVVGNVAALARQRIDVVLGTTGWLEHEKELRKTVSDAGIGIVAAPNFSTGVVLFESLVASAARMFQTQQAFGATFTKRITPRKRMRRQAPRSS
jgi:4-hydroxy-tetrahydrodipicolinate reductase